MRRALNKPYTTSPDDLQLTSVDADKADKDSSAMRPFASVWVVMTLYVVTGMLQPTIIDFIKYHGMIGAPHAMLPMLGTLHVLRICAGSPLWSTSARFPAANVAGMAAVALCRSSTTGWNDIPRNSKRNILLITAVDTCSGVFLMLGLLAAGSGVFVVIYSSCTAFTACFSRMFLKKQLKWGQWLAILMICAGLGVNYWSASHGGAAATASGVRTAAGIVLTLLGSLLHSAMFVMTDALLSKAGTEAKPWQVCSYVGRFEVAGLLCWNAFGIVYASTTDDSWFKFGAADGSAPTAASIGLSCVLFASLWAVNCLHAACFFDLIGAVGSVSSAVLKGVQTVSVYVLSAILYCRYQSSQCFSYTKALSLVIVVLGTSIYSLASGAHKPSSSSSSGDSVEGATLVSCECGGLSGPNGVQPVPCPVPLDDEDPVAPGHSHEADETAELLERKQSK